MKELEYTLFKGEGCNFFHHQWNCKNNDLNTFLKHVPGHFQFHSGPFFT